MGAHPKSTLVARSHLLWCVSCIPIGGGVPRASTSLSTRSSRGHLQPPQKPNAAAEHVAQVRCHAGCPWALEVAARGARYLRLEPSPCNNVMAPDLLRPAGPRLPRRLLRVRWICPKIRRGFKVDSSDSVSSAIRIHLRLRCSQYLLPREDLHPRYDSAYALCV